MDAQMSYPALEKQVELIKNWKDHYIGNKNTQMKEPRDKVVPFPSKLFLPIFNFATKKLYFQFRIWFDIYD